MYRAFTVACVAAVLWTSAAQGQHRASRPDTTSPTPTTTSRTLDQLGERLFNLERQAEADAASLYANEDEEFDVHKFYQSSAFIFTLAVAADSSNARAEYHLGQVLARKSYQGNGEWDVDSLRVAVQHLRHARTIAVGSYLPLRVHIEADLRREQANLDSLTR